MKLPELKKMIRTEVLKEIGLSGGSTEPIGHLGHDGTPNIHLGIILKHLKQAQYALKKSKISPLYLKQLTNLIKAIQADFDAK